MAELKLRGGLVKANEIHTLFIKPPVEKIQSRYWFEIYVDAGCNGSCNKDKKCGDLEHYGECAWSHVSFVYCKACQSLIDVVDRRTGESMNCYEEWHAKDCQRFRLQTDRFKRGIRGRKCIAASIVETESTNG